MRIYIVIKEEVWDGETWNATYGAYYNKEDAIKELQDHTEELREDYKNETIEEDTAEAFFAYREGEYSQYHVSLTVEETELK